jgi:hypothetical protein
MVCEAYGVEDEEDLPKEVQDIDVVKFAELPPSTIASIVVSFSAQLIVAIIFIHNRFPFPSTSTHAEDKRTWNKTYCGIVRKN